MRKGTLHKIMQILCEPRRRFKLLDDRGCFDRCSDEWFVTHKFKAYFGRELNLENPRSFNEKLQWLKLYDRNPAYTAMVDKFEVKEYVEKKLGREYIIPTLGVWESFDQIDFDALPNRFVLKCTHNSGGVVICRDKNHFDREKARATIERCLKRDYYLHGREWPYRDVKRRIIAEAYLEDPVGDLRDYKFMCFNGEAKCILVCAERSSESGVKMSFFDTEWNLMPLHRRHPQIDKKVEKPEKLEQMLTFTGILSEDIPFARIDFYEVAGKVYFGEITFFPASGFGAYEPDNWDEILGSWLKLPEKRSL